MTQDRSSSTLASPAPGMRNPVSPFTRAWGGTLVVLLLLIGGWWYSASVRDVQVQLTGATMGTTYTVKIPRVPEPIVAETLQTELDRLLAKVNRQMSTYDPESELSRFNRNPSTAWVSVSPELLFVVQEAHRVSQLTGGAFDVTVGPLVNLWGFGPTVTDDDIPTDQAITEAQTRVGYHHLQIRDDPPALKKTLPDLSVDLSAIAKGYAVDLLADYLETLDVSDYMVEIGGELRVKGHNAQGASWRIAIEKPTPNERTVERIISLTDQGIATSGDYRNFFERDGQRYSHAIDPTTGRPIRHDLASVSVVHPSTTLADAWATGLIVSGSRERLATRRTARLSGTIHRD
ncbi:MAG: FAD:protein FMN transferase [Candidatus Competibacteraceae bacterium]